MTSLVRTSATALLALAGAAAPLSAQGSPCTSFQGRVQPGLSAVVFDFDPVPPGLESPLTACFGGGPFTELRATAMVPEAPGFVGTRFGVTTLFAEFGPADLTIAFDRPIASITFPFQLRGEVGTTLLDLTLDAFSQGTPVGTCRTVATSFLVHPTLGMVVGEAGILPTCAPGTFDSVVIHSADLSPNIWIDGVQVAVSPEPVTVLLLASGLSLVGVAARVRRRR